MTTAATDAAVPKCDDPAYILALTICQPYAWAVMQGLKRFENREWHSDYVGPLVIHAGRSEKFLAQGLADLKRLKIVIDEPLVYGAILGVVDMVDCVRPGPLTKTAGRQDPFASGPYCQVYEKPRRLSSPVPYLGKQRFFYVPREHVAELLPAVDAPSPAVEETRDEKLQRAIAAAGLGNLRPAANG